MKAYLEGLTATHSGDHVYLPEHALMASRKRKVYPKAAPGRSHPSGDEAQGALRQWRLHHP